MRSRRSWSGSSPRWGCEMEMLGFAVLLGIATGYLWGDYLANKKANKRLEFWRSTAAMAKTEAEFMVKELAEVTAQREAASARADDMLCQIEAYKTRTLRAERTAEIEVESYRNKANANFADYMRARKESDELKAQLRIAQEQLSEDAKALRREQAAARRAKKAKGEP